jgi:hypothetical protein
MEGLGVTSHIAFPEVHDVGECLAKSSGCHCTGLCSQPCALLLSLLLPLAHQNRLPPHRKTPLLGDLPACVITPSLSVHKLDPSAARR